jgi:DNA-binding NarL/FixJ family response regulator
MSTIARVPLSARPLERRGPDAAGRRSRRRLPPQLTERELEVLELLAERRTNAEIAAKLFLSQKTVRNYVSGILAKLQVADRAEARLVARAAGIGTDDPSP